MYAGAHCALEHPAWTLRRSHASCQMVATEGGPRFSERLTTPTHPWRCIRVHHEIRRITTALSATLPSQIWSRIVEPTVPGIRELKECISTQLAAKDKSTDPKKSLAVPFNERFSHWENYWNTNVFVGMPPALVDWLWVESTPPTQATRGAEIFVPGYSDDDLSPMPTDHSIR